MARCMRRITTQCRSAGRWSPRRRRDGLPLDPTVAALIGNTFTANVAGISDYDGFAAGESYHYQWQMQDLTTDKWLSLAGATSQTYTATNFVLGSPLRVLVSGSTARAIPNRSPRFRPS